MLKNAKSAAAQFGYTLLEVLLVLAVIAVIAGMGIFTFRQRAENSRAEKVALELQQTLQAAMAYRVDNTSKQWPDSHDGNQCYRSAAADGFVTTYLPNASNRNSLGSYLCWGPMAGNKRFWVALHVPQQDAHWAQAIAAYLPNAITTAQPSDASASPPACNSNDCFVRAEVTVPGLATENAARSNISGVGNCMFRGSLPGSVSGMNCEYQGTQNNDRDVQFQLKFNCRPGEIGGAMVMPNSFTNRVFSKSNDTEPLYQLVPSNFGMASCQTSTEGAAACQFFITATYYDGSDGSGAMAIVDTNAGGTGNVGVSYIAYCRGSDS